MSNDPLLAWSPKKVFVPSVDHFSDSPCSERFPLQATSQSLTDLQNRQCLWLELSLWLLSLDFDADGALMRQVLRMRSQTLQNLFQGRFLAERIFRGFLFLGRRFCFSRILSPDFSLPFCGYQKHSTSRKIPGKEGPGRPLRCCSWMTRSQAQSSPTRYMFQQLARHILGGFISLGGVTGGRPGDMRMKWAYAHEIPHLK